MIVATKPEIRDAIERYGSDLTGWPNRNLAQQVRVAALADADVRQWLADARAIATTLGKAAAVLDDDIARSGAAERVSEAVLTQVTVSTRPRTRWIAVAATMLLAAGVGGIVQLARDLPSDGVNPYAVFLDPLVYGPAGVDQ